MLSSFLGFQRLSIIEGNLERMLVKPGGWRNIINNTEVRK
jgi:hypothetical protein